MSIAHSSQGFVRALKAPSDPPVPGGPLKIDIARRAWDDTSFHVPNKSEVIVDWILNKILKEKNDEPPQNPLLDPQYWILLCDILSFTNVPTSGVAFRPIKIWLPTLLNRTPLAPIFTRFLNLLDGLGFDLQNQLSEIFSSCFGIMWPLSVQKIGTETLLECFGALLNSLPLCERNMGIARVGGMVISSYRNSLWNSPNKKKIYLLFLQTHLEQWLDCSTLGTQSDWYKLLLEASYEAGIDTILNADILRQTRDSNLGNTLFEAIATASSSNPTVLATLPRIFASYIPAVKMHRGSLFGQGSNQLPGAVIDESNAFGMRFFVACNSLLDHAGPTAQTWSTRVHLLSLVDRENIFSRGQLDALGVLNQLVESALSSLEDTQNDQTMNPTYAIESLSTLARIDYEFILPTLPRILSAILVHESSPAYIQFLDLLLGYHTKTRTMNTYVASLLSASSPQHKLSILGGAQVLYRRCHAGPLMDSAHLDSLSRAIYGFLSSTQLSPLVNLVVESLGQAWGQLYDSKEISDDNNIDFAAIGISLSIRLCSIVIASLPLNSVPNRQDILRSLSDVRNTLIPRTLTKAFKRIRKTGEANAWGFQVAAAAFLRLRYALDMSRHLTLEQSNDLKQLSTAQAILALDGLMPELRIEIFRTLLGSTGLRHLTETQAVLDCIIASLTENSQDLGVYWSKNLHQLLPEGNNTAAGSLALLHMVVEKWLPVIESVASSTQLKSFFQHIMCTHSQYSASLEIPGMKNSSLVAQMLQSAQFWEYQNIRNTFLASISEATLVLDNISDTLQLSSALPVYRMLLHFPMEYISRSCRTELTKRAMAADLFITRSLEGSNHAADDTLQNLSILRVFLNRVFLHSGFTEHSAQSLCELSRCMMVGSGSHMQYDNEFSSATINLMNSLFSDILYRSTISNPDTISTTIAFLEMVRDSSLEVTDFRFQHAIQMIEILDERFVLTNFPEEIQILLQGIHHRLSSYILPQIQKFSGTGISTRSLDHQCNVLKMWCALLMLGQWLGLTDSLLPRLGKAFLVDVAKASTKGRTDTKMWDTLLAGVSTVLLKELHYLKESDCLSHLSLITASYLTLSGILSADGRKQLDNSLSKTCQTLSLSQFIHILSLVGEGLTTLSISEGGLAHLIEFSILLLHNHPQGTLKYVQIHTTECLSTFVGRGIFTEGPVWLRIQVLEFVVQHCSDRPAALRLGDLNSIWTLLARFLSGSRVHDDQTTSSIFHSIVMIVSALVRFRRDLVALTLPHLGGVLRQLLMSVRGVRPLLGSKQTTLVTDTQPRWVNSQFPLGAEEGKVLARLLETLATKSIVRNNAMAFEVQKAESLVKPFSKHASYALKAYIEAMNDPLCILHSDLRRELQRGLYALCSMVSDHSRDAMMLSALDSGGKLTMKALWKEYEKQKYVGKG